MILDSDSPNNDSLSEEQHEVVETAAEMLYGLIHVRYILTARGMAAMHEKFKKSHFGTCPRVLCTSQPCLPIGTNDIPRQCTVKVGLLSGMRHRICKNVCGSQLLSILDEASCCQRSINHCNVGASKY